jgi:hypothetical protein
MLGGVDRGEHWIHDYTLFLSSTNQLVEPKVKDIAVWTDIMI